MALDLPKISKEVWEDWKWCREHYTELQRQFKDMVIAVAGKKVVAYGKDGTKVREVAKRISGRQEVYTEFIESGVAIY